MDISSPLVLLRRAGGGMLVGQVAVGNGVAGLLQRRSPDAVQSYTAAALGAGTPLHGGNAAGLVCLALDAGGQALVRVVLEGASTAADARAAVQAWRRGASGATLHAGALLAVDTDSAVLIEISAGGSVECRPIVPGQATEDTSNRMQEIVGVFAAVRAAEPTPREGAVPASAMAALLAPGEPPRLYFALGPPSCSVFTRHWPGLELTPLESAGPEGAPAARLAVAVAQATATDNDLRAAVRSRLDDVEAEAVQEGEAAEAMAQRMAADTDARGAAVRRLVAQSYAAELVEHALAELAVPAPSAGVSRQGDAPER